MKNTACMYVYMYVCVFNMYVCIGGNDSAAVFSQLRCQGQRNQRNYRHQHRTRADVPALQQDAAGPR